MARRRCPAPAGARPVATLLAGAVLAAPPLAAQAAPAGDAVVAPIPPVPRPPTRPTRARRDAVAAQGEFERARRAGLAPWSGTAGRCDVRVGRFCYWDNNADPPPPPEPPRVGADRERLLARLARAAAADPSDEWIAGQRVRYLLEAGRPDSALAAARACGGTAACLALRGLAHHLADAHAPAAAAFDSALAALPEAERCARRDLTPWLEGRDLTAWRATGCGTAARTEWERRFWRLARPLWSLPGDDLRSELDARRVMARLQSGGVHPQATPWGPDLEELELRYGWPAAWSREPAGVYAPFDVHVVGHEPVPSWSFVPPPGRVAALVAAPTRAEPADWALAPELPRTRYAPRWARGGFVALEHQLARFRRGDTLVLAAGWTLDADTAWAAGPRRAALLVADDSLHDAAAATLDSAGMTGGLVARVGPGSGALLASLELLSPAGRRAGRARRPVERPTPGPLSDLLLLRAPSAEAPDGPPARVEDAVATVLGAPIVPSGGAVRLFWERYDAAPGGAADTVAVTAVRTSRGVGDRLRALVGAETVARPVAVRTVDAGRADGAPGRSLVVRWPPVPAGRYRLELVVTGAAGEVGRAALDVRVTGPPSDGEPPRPTEPPAGSPAGPPAGSR